MECPCCKEPMIVLELHRVETDHCLVCGGIWLDAGELELLLESSEERDALLNSFQVEKPTTEARRKCPICRKKMKKISCGRDKKVLIDKCRRNDGLWFDRGELRGVIEAGGLDQDNKMLHLLRDMFGENR